jgi:hypothetical protein
MRRTGLLDTPSIPLSSSTLPASPPQPSWHPGDEDPKRHGAGFPAAHNQRLLAKSQIIPEGCS